MSFLQVQDGILDSAGKIMDRMPELKSLSQDVLKNSSDIANYNSEFKSLQVQLYQIAQTKFNGVSLLDLVQVQYSVALKVRMSQLAFLQARIVRVVGHQGSAFTVLCFYLPLRFKLQTLV